MTGSVDERELLALYTTMARIRAFEDRVAQQFRGGNVHGFVHVSIGQEASAVGVCAALTAEDYITTTHRGHGHCLARGADPEGMMAELFGRETGLCRGRGGSMHLADASLGILGANGIVGAGVPLAVGAALAAQVRGDGRVAVAFFGEGAVHTGAFHEALTLAVAWSLPVVFVCEVNGWAEFTPNGEWGGPEPAARGACYGLAAEALEGHDVLVVRDAATRIVDAARDGGGPALLELRTVRGHGHYEGDAQPYREDQAWEAHDPLTLARGHLADAALADPIDAAADEEMDRVVALALAAPYPDPATVLEHVHG